jgi:hypothetical protein
VVFVEVHPELSVDGCCMKTCTYCLRLFIVVTEVRAKGYINNGIRITGINPSPASQSTMGLEVIIWAAVFTETTVFSLGFGQIASSVVRTIKAYFVKSQPRTLIDRFFFFSIMLNTSLKALVRVTMRKQTWYLSCLLLVAGGTHPKWHPTHS